MEESYKDHLYALIVCGGAGTRLWPRSRQKTPKQFLEKFYGEETLFDQTFERAKLLTEEKKIFFVVTSSQHADYILSSHKDVLPENVIVEPVGRNTAMAVGIGAAFIKKTDPNGVIMNFWSDAVVKENELFVQSLDIAAETAYTGNWLVVVGLRPTFPHTGLGYIETAGEFKEAAGGVLKVNSFKEKPDLATAEQFIAKGNFFWNTGIYVWSVKAVFGAFLKHSPGIYSLLERITNGIDTAQEKEIVLKAYEEAESISIDVAVSEKADNLLLVPAAFTWSDIGDWKVTYDLKQKDGNGNVIETFGGDGWHLGVDTKNCLIETKDRLIATVGVSDLVIIETDDAILVCAKEKAQDVKKIVAGLKEQNREDLL